MLLRPFAALLFAALSIAPAAAAWSQDAADAPLTPPAPVGSAQGEIVVAQETSLGDLVARIQRLEGANRQLTGRVDELTNALRKSQQDFAKYRDDTEFRLQALEAGPATGGGKPKKRTEAPVAPATTDTAAAEGTLLPQGAGPGKGAAPADLGTLPADPAFDSGALQDDTATAEADNTQPLDLTAPPQDDTALAPLVPDTGAGGVNAGAAPAGGAKTSLLPPGLPGLATDKSQPLIAAAPSNAPKDEFDLAYGFLQRKDYEIAEMSFRKFVTDHPDDLLVPDATHWLGESLFQRKQYRDAAEFFLKVTTDYAKSRRAPSSMLRLGMSLANLSEKEAACATFQEIARKYPTASDTVKAAVQRETARAKC